MIFDMPGCGGCSTCEIACSYRHTGVFKPSLSSIKIIDKENNEPGFRVLLIGSTGEDGIACDGCKDYEEPFCIAICHKKEELEKIIREYLDAGKAKAR
jgi:Fe-S-cluster-containing hydrogenase component 2